jgi:hypothetical protein
VLRKRITLWNIIFAGAYILIEGYSIVVTLFDFGPRLVWLFKIHWFSYLLLAICISIISINKLRAYRYSFVFLTALPILNFYVAPFVSYYMRNKYGLGI